MVVGHRCYPQKDGRCSMSRGDFGKNANGVWWVCLPESGHWVSLLDLATPVTEHPDKTISVGGPIRIIVRNERGEVERSWKLDHGRWEKTERALA